MAHASELPEDARVEVTEKEDGVWWMAGRVILVDGFVSVDGTDVSVPCSPLNSEGKVLALTWAQAEDLRDKLIAVLEGRKPAV